jgi:hypothetical protein
VIFPSGVNIRTRRGSNTDESPMHIPTKRFSSFSSLLPLTALLLATMGVGPCGSQPLGSVDAGATCSLGGKTYAAGATFPATDGCNSCTCQADGVACTTKGCPTDGPPSTDGSTPVSCTYAGKTYGVGATFPDTDGCNKCSCEAGGQVACTLLACFDASSDGPTTCIDSNGAVRKDGEAWTTSDGCNSCSCAAGTASCTHRTCLSDAGATDGAGTCQYQGVTHAAKDTFPAADGCNTCTCTSGGLVACTVQSCPQPNPDASTLIPCSPGKDFTCNEDPTIQSLRGTCLPDGTCKCTTPTSPITGRCLNPSNPAGTGCEQNGAVYPEGSLVKCPYDCGTCTCLAGKLTNSAGACDSCQDILFTSGPCVAESVWRQQAADGCAASGKYLTKLYLNACADGSTYGSGSYKCCDRPPPCGNNTCKPGVHYCALVSVGGVYKTTDCVPYPTGCSTCGCALKDATPMLQAACGNNPLTCTDGVSALQSTDSSSTLTVTCAVP